MNNELEKKLQELKFAARANPPVKKRAGEVAGADSRLSPDEIRSRLWIVTKVSPSGTLKMFGEEYELNEIVGLTGSDSEIRLIKMGYLQSVEMYVVQGEATDLRKIWAEKFEPLIQKQAEAENELNRAEKAYLQAKIVIDDCSHAMERSHSQLSKIEDELSDALDSVDFGEGDEPPETETDTSQPD